MLGSRNFMMSRRLGGPLANHKVSLLVVGLVFFCLFAVLNGLLEFNSAVYFGRSKLPGFGHSVASSDHSDGVAFHEGPCMFSAPLDVL